MTLLEFDASDPLVAFIDVEGVIYIEGMPYTPKENGYGYEIIWEGQPLENLKDPSETLTFASYEILYAVALVAFRAVQELPGISSDYVESLLLLLRNEYYSMFPAAKGYDL